ncbi:hypothetical protein GH714_031059 [Hevea brasiliensis]|uniref:Uncharacterized protein n=1 Tax=Hevea brasiliensis TaxID=3981 RepID=A0A6A6N3R5_HEVBR|nr:hypothetical protein GH714_031059 [Hevea brasiliensis]
MESMLDFVHRSVGSERDFKIVEIKHPTMSAPILQFQDYIVLEDPQEIEGPGMVCHPIYQAFLGHYDVEHAKIAKVGALIILPDHLVWVQSQASKAS